MTPLSVLEKLNSFKTISGVKKFLEKLDPESEFWVGAHYCLQPFGSWKVHFALSDPHSFGKGAPDGVLTKIIVGMESGSLPENDVLIALGKVSQTCTRDQWKNWYRPVLERTLLLPFGIDLFNEVCPEGLKVDRWWAASSFYNLTSRNDIPKRFFMEPYYGDKADRTIWFCTPKSSRSYYFDTGKEFVHENSKELMEIAADMGGGIIFDGWLENDNLTLRDFITFDEFFTRQELVPLHHRVDVLQMICEVLYDKGITSIEMIEMIDASESDIQTVRNDMNMIFEQLFSGIIVRGDKSSFVDDALIIQPNKQSILTCIDITEKEIIGSGMMNKKSFETKVFYGLTLQQKEQYLKDKDSFLGSKFAILSCGMDPVGNIMFPLFKEWRK